MHRAEPRRLLICLAVACLQGCAPQQSGGPDQNSAADVGAVAPTTTEAADDRRVLTADLDHPALRAPLSVPGELLVKFKARANAAEVLRKSGAQRAQTFKSVPGLSRVRVTGGMSIPAALERLRADPGVEYAEPNYLLSKRAIPDDPRFSEQWSLHNTGQTGGSTDYDINAPEGWDLQTSAANVVIAVIDSGIDYDHEDLAANIWRNTVECTANGMDDDSNGYVDDCHGIDTANGDSDPMDDDGHGTHVAGILGAVGNNGVGISGVAWNVQMLSCKFLAQDGTGTTANAIACLDYIGALKDRGVNVVASNNSWGGYEYSQALHDAVEAQRDKGIVLVAASGNDGIELDRLRQYPCALDLDNIICVGNFPTNGPWDPSSNFGVFLVHVTAPGAPVLSTLPGNQYGLASGTSMAAPHVAGVVALLAAADPARHWRRTRNLALSGGYYDVGYGSVIQTVTWRRPRLDLALACSNQIVKSRLKPDYRVRNPHRAGVPIDIEVMHVNCGVPNGNLTANVSPGGLSLNLVDDGAGADRIAGDGRYSARWTPTVAGNYTVNVPGALNESLQVTVDEHIKPGFPVQQIQLAGRLSKPVYMTVGNFAGDARPEIVTTSTAQGPIYVWNGDGTKSPGWPILDADGAIITRGVAYTALAELDGDPARSELAAAYWYGDVFAYGGGATVLPGWPRRTVSTQEVADPTVAGDIDGDGRDEIFVYDLGTELVYRHDGTRLPGWEPVHSGMPNIADLDGDGVAEFITGTVPLQNINTVIRALHADGSSLPGFPVDLGAIVGGQTLVGDIDGDGRNEILVVANFGAIRKITDTGTTSTLIDPPPSPYHLLRSEASLADLDADGIPEIVLFGDGAQVGVNYTYLYAYRGNGTLLPGFPVIGSGYNDKGDYMAVVGDVDGDQLPDIVYGSQSSGYGGSQVWAVNRLGAVLPGFPKELWAASGAAPALADLDLNGRNDIIIYGQSPDLGSNPDSLWVYEIPGAGPHGPIEWSQLAGDASHRGYYELGKNLPGHAFLSVRVRGSGRITATGIDCGTDCVERVVKGANVTLTASGSAGQAFTGWLGACAGQGNPCTVAVSRYTSVVARFNDSADNFSLTVTKSGAGNGLVTSAPIGINCPGDCSENFHSGATITLSATAAGPDSHFTEWTGACASTLHPTCVVTMNAARSVGVVFDSNNRLDVTTSGPGVVTSSPAGIDCGTDCSEWFAQATPVLLTAAPLAGASFLGWTGDCSGATNACLVNMDGQRNVTATFVALTPVTVTLAGSGSGTVTSATAGINCGSDCTDGYAPNTRVTLHAAPAPGSRFGGFTGACVSQVGDCAFDVTSTAAAITATFIEQHALTVTASGSGSVSSGVSGIQCGIDCSEDYDDGTSIVLTATAVAGNNFTGWTGACSGTSSSCTVTMSQARTVGATFVLIATAPVTPPAPAKPAGGGGGRIDIVMLMLAALVLAFRLRVQRNI